MRHHARQMANSCLQIASISAPCRDLRLQFPLSTSDEKTQPIREEGTYDQIRTILFFVSLESCLLNARVRLVLGKPVNGFALKKRINYDSPCDMQYHGVYRYARRTKWLYVIVILREDVRSTRANKWNIRSLEASRRHASKSRRMAFLESHIGAKIPSRIKNAVGNGSRIIIAVQWRKRRPDCEVPSVVLCQVLLVPSHVLFPLTAPI